MCKLVGCLGIVGLLICRGRVPPCIPVPVARAKTLIEREEAIYCAARLAATAIPTRRGLPGGLGARIVRDTCAADHRPVPPLGCGMPRSVRDDVFSIAGSDIVAKIP
jgi:hypothetical protein